MTTKLLSSAALIAVLTASGAQAQVVTAFSDTVDDALAAASGSFAGFALNDMGIDGSIDISATGTSGGTEDNSTSNTDNSSSSSDDVTATDTSTDGTTVVTGEAAATAGGIGTSIAGDVADATGGGTANAQSSTTTNDIATNIDNSSLSTTNNIATEAIVTATTSTNAATQVFGNISTLAAGAVNDGTFDITESAGGGTDVSSSSTSDTNANASSSTGFGSGVGIVNAAVNDVAGSGGLAGINGSVTASIGGGNVTVGSIDTVAAGAINTTNATAAFFGTQTP